MQIFLAVVSAILGVINVLQWITGYVSGNALRAKAQASYNQWFRVAELAEQIRRDPERAVELAASINGMADAVRHEIVAYSRERLDFVPRFDPAWEPSSDFPKPRGLWAKIRLGFSMK